MNTMNTKAEIEEEQEETPIAYCERCEQEVFDAGCLRTVYRRNSSYRLVEENWCEECRDSHASQCADCEDYHEELSGNNSDDDAICSSCSENYFYCEGCSSTFHNDAYAGDGHCINCYHDENSLLDHDVEIDTRPIGESKIYFGVELEVECKYDPEDQIESTRSLVDDFAYLKSDGSLNNGFEIVTRPMSLAKHVEKWAKFFANRPKGLKSFETSTCGLHVHCSREPLTEMQIAKAVCFVNAERNRAFIRTIAQRESNSWAAIKPKKLSEAYKRNRERYEAVNLQNTDTIEFRIFKGTLRQVSFLKSIEFCDALLQFCAPASRSLTDSMQSGLFCEFVSKNKKDWPHLHAFIEAKVFGRSNELTKKFGFQPSENNREE